MSNKSTIGNIFATRDDLVPVLQEVELRHALKYLECGLFGDAERPVFHSSSELENLGISVAGDSNLEPTFLVLRSQASLKVREVLQRRGGIKYAVDQMNNPESIALKPGGRYGDSAIIAGMVGTVHHDKVAGELMAAFLKAFKARFTRVKSYMVGPEALKLLNLGFRLTKSISSPREFDLAL
jgi:hypothetical protein